MNSADVTALLAEPERWSLVAQGWVTAASDTLGGRPMWRMVLQVGASIRTTWVPRRAR